MGQKVHQTWDLDRAFIRIREEKDGELVADLAYKDYPRYAGYSEVSAVELREIAHALSEAADVIDFPSEKADDDDDRVAGIPASEYSQWEAESRADLRLACAKIAAGSPPFNSVVVVSQAKKIYDFVTGK